MKFDMIVLLLAISNLGNVFGGQSGADICPDGMFPDSTLKFCCPDSCTECGGKDCAKQEEVANACCSGSVKTSCFEENPSFKEDSPCGDVVPERPGKPDKTGKKPMCPRGGIMATVTKSNGYTVDICCPKACGSCDTSTSCTADDDCCAFKIAEPPLTAYFTPSGPASCTFGTLPCMMPPNDDPCEDYVCENGARCGYSFSANNICYTKPICLCEELGYEYYGPLCESECADGEYCGQLPFFIPPPPDNCCSSDDICIISPDLKTLCKDKNTVKDTPEECGGNSEPITLLDGSVKFSCILLS